MFILWNDAVSQYACIINTAPYFYQPRYYIYIYIYIYIYKPLKVKGQIWDLSWHSLMVLNSCGFWTWLSLSTGKMEMQLRKPLPWRKKCRVGWYFLSLSWSLICQCWLLNELSTGRTHDQPARYWINVRT